MKNRKLRAPALIIIAALLLSLCACSAAGVGGSAGKLSLDYEQRAEEINSAAAGSGAVASGFQFENAGRSEAPQPPSSSGEEPLSGMEAYYSFGTGARESGSAPSGGSAPAPDGGAGAAQYGGRPAGARSGAGEEQPSAGEEQQAEVSYAHQVTIEEEREPDEEDDWQEREERQEENREERQEESRQEEQTPSRSSQVTITIRCDTAVNNGMHQDAKWSGIVPASGCILPVTSVDIEGGETVFDILASVCDKYKIHMSYRGGTGSGCYVDGINNLYEFDGGRWSGWMYSVNGWYPNYGCGVYFVNDGDDIEWNYTCDLGLDLDSDWWEGASEWKETHD